MTLNIIHDNRQPQRHVDLMLELSEQQITDYKIWEATVLPESVVKSINASHKKIVRWAKENNQESVCIAEDDVWFPSKNGWRYFLEKMPNEFDIYLGGSYIVSHEGFIQICGFHLYMVHQKFYDTFLAAPDSVHIDSYFNEIEGDYQFCRPFAALQRPAYSANCSAFVDYNAVIDKSMIYYGE